MSSPSECRACHEAIEWVVVAKSGRRMPIDPGPHPAGGLVGLGRTDATGAEYVRVLTRGESRIVAGNLYRSHFASCRIRRKVNA